MSCTILPGEFALIERLRGRMTGPEGQVWVGDDVALVPGPLGSLLLASDAVFGGIVLDAT